MTYWLPWIWLLGPSSFAFAVTLGVTRHDRRVSPLASVPLLWAGPLFGALAAGMSGSGGKLMFSFALWVLLAGWAAQLALCTAVGIRAQARPLATLVFVFNMPSSFMALFGLGQGASGVMM